MPAIRNYSGRNFKTSRQPDILTPEQRSLLMSKIRAKRTHFEKEFCKLLLTTLPIRPRFNCKDIFGKPDIAFKKNRVCVFLDSNFWHGWQYPRWKHKLKSDFWRKKIEANRKRDRKVNATLRGKSWKVIRLWEHSLKNDPEGAIRKIIESLES